ncbi:hypothetical protein MIR68_006362 [Amoeboaphelidium protococcarum]|nr:hypothetical protein MIR68_006362 [Amoeboaphelidium protococcarum]
MSSRLGSKVAFLAGSLGTLSVGSLLYLYGTDSRAAVHKYVSLPIIRKLYDGEESHELAIKLAKMGLFPVDRVKDDSVLSVKLFGKKVGNVVGLAAGFDKNAEVVDAMFNAGFGIVEVGSITPLPQEGNPRPRVFRLEEEQAVINRYGFNCKGSDFAAECLRQRFIQKDTEYKSGVRGKVLGINLGKNKISAESSNSDYVEGAIKFGDFADYLVINVSSPNTPNLRALQQKDTLRSLIHDVKKAIDHLQSKPAIVLKVAPDLNDQEIADISQVLLEEKVDGLIVSNTTVQRPGTIANQSGAKEAGGLSGSPLQELSLSALRKFYKNTSGKITIIGCGGISSGEDALDFILNGAFAIQLYTAMVYQGPGLVREIKDYLAEECNQRGVKNISELVGQNLKLK